MAKLNKAKTPQGTVTWGNTKVASEEDGNYKIVVHCPLDGKSLKLARELTASRIEFLKEINSSGKADKVTNLKKIAERNAKLHKVLEKLEENPDCYDDYEMVLDAGNGDAGLPFSVLKDEDTGALVVEFVARQKAKITMKNGEEIDAKFMFYQGGKQVDPVDIFAGSEVEVGFCTYHWLNKSKCGVSLRQKAYNIISLSERTGGADDDFGFGSKEENEFGFEQEAEDGDATPTEPEELDLDVEI